MDRRLLLLLLRGSLVIGAVLGIPVLQLRALAGAQPHPALLKLLVVFDLQGQEGKERAGSVLQHQQHPSAHLLVSPAAPRGFFPPISPGHGEICSDPFVAQEGGGLSVPRVGWARWVRCERRLPVCRSTGEEPLQHLP